jgi:hypothetical protein
MPDRPPPWRCYSDLTPAEKTRVRKMYVAGDDLSGIAQRCRVYAGTISSAAERLDWQRKGNAKSLAERIGEAIAKRPTLTNDEVADMLNARPRYVAVVRRRIKSQAK